MANFYNKNFNQNSILARGKKEDEEDFSYFNRLYENTFNPVDRVTTDKSSVKTKIEDIDTSDTASLLDSLYVTEEDFDSYTKNLMTSAENELLKEKDYANLPLNQVMTKKLLSPKKNTSSNNVSNDKSNVLSNSVEENKTQNTSSPLSEERQAELRKQIESINALPKKEQQKALKQLLKDNPDLHNAYTDELDKASSTAGKNILDKLKGKDFFSDSIGDIMNVFSDSKYAVDRNIENFIEKNDDKGILRNAGAEIVKGGVNLVNEFDKLYTKALYGAAGRDMSDNQKAEMNKSYIEKSTELHDKIEKEADEFSTLDENSGFIEKVAKSTLSSTITLGIGLALGNPVALFGLSSGGASISEAEDRGVKNPVLYGNIIGTIESVSELWFGSKFMNNVMNSTGFRTVKELFKNVGERGIKAITIESLKEGGQEMATELAEMIVSEFFKDENGVSMAPQTLGEGLEQLAIAGASGGLMGGVGPTINTIAGAKGNTNTNTNTDTNTDTKSEPKSKADKIQELNEAFGFEAVTEEELKENLAEKIENSLSETVASLEGTNTPENIENAKLQGENAIEEGASTEVQNISENTSPNINRNAPFLSKTIDNGKEVYITEEGNTVNAKLAEMVAENKGIPIERITQFTAEDSAIIENDAKASRIIDNIDTSITENGVEETIKALETDVANGSITEEAYNTAMQYVEARGQLTEGNANQQELTRNNAETVNNNPNTEMLTKVDNKRQEITKNNTADTTNTEANNVRYDNSSSSNIENTTEAPKKVSKKVREAQEKIDKITKTKTFKDTFKDTKLKAVEKLNVEQRTAKKLAKEIGRDVIFYEAEGTAPNGFFKEDTLFINNSFKGDNLMSVLGHETFHSLKKTDRKTFNELVKWGEDNFSTREINKFLSKIENEAEVERLSNNPKLLSEEMLAESFGTDFANKDFWNSLETTNKTLFEKVKDFIVKILKKAENNTNDFLTKKHIKELRAEFESILGKLTDTEAEVKTEPKTEAKTEKEEGSSSENNIKELGKEAKSIFESRPKEDFTNNDKSLKPYYKNIYELSKEFLNKDNFKFERRHTELYDYFSDVRGILTDIDGNKTYISIKANSLTKGNPILMYSSHRVEAFVGANNPATVEIDLFDTDTFNKQFDDIFNKIKDKKVLAPKKETSSKTETKDDVKVNNNVTQKLSDFTKTFISEYTDKLGKPKQYDLEEAFRSTLEEYNEKYGLDYKEAESIVNKQLNDAGIPSLDLSYLYDYKGYTERQYLKEQEEARLEAEIEEETKAPEKVLAPKQEAKYNEIKKDLHMLYEVLGDSIVDNDIETQNFIKKDIKNLFKKAKDNKLDMAEINKIEAESKKWSEYISNEKGFKVNDTVYKIEKWKNGYALTNGEFLYEVKNANDVDTKLQELKTDNKVLAPKQKAEPKKKSTKTLSPKYKGKSVLSTMDVDYTNRLIRDFETLSKQNSLKFLNDYIPELKNISEDIKTELNSIKKESKGLKFLEKRKFEEAKIKELDNKYGISQKVDEVYNRLANTIPNKTKLQSSLNGIIEATRTKDTSIKKEFTKYLNDIADVYDYEVKNIREIAPKVKNKDAMVFVEDKSYNYTAEFFKDGKAITTIETRFMPDFNSISFNSVIYFENKNSTSIDKNKNLFDVSQGIQKNEYIQKSLQNDDVKFSTRKGKEFNEWFEGSVMVKENGKPETYYHTTDAVFNDFNDNAEIKNGRYFGAGHYFTKKIQRRDTYKNSGYDYGKKKYIANLKMTNPMNISEYADLKIAQDIADTITARYGTEASEKVRNSIDNTGGLFWADLLSLIEYDHPKNDFRNILKEYGFDGVYDDYESVYVAFSNDQVNIKTRVDEDGVRFSTRTQQEVNNTVEPLLEISNKLNDLQLRTGIKSIHKTKISKDINLVETFKDAIDFMATNDNTAIENEKAFKKSLIEKGINKQEAGVISKYFTNIVEIAKQSATEFKPNPANVITTSKYKGKQAPLKDRVGINLERAYSRFTDTNYFGKKLAGDDVYRKARLTTTSFGISENILTEALTDKNGNIVDVSLKDVLLSSIPEGREVDFMNYSLNKHNIARATQEKYVFYKENGEPMSSSDSAKIVAELEAKNPDFKDRAERMTGWINKFMKTWGVDTGILSEDLYNTMLAMYPDYIPTNRNFNDHEEFFGGSFGGRGFVDKTKPTKKLNKGGSARDIIDIQESLVNLVVKTVKTAKMNEVGQSLLEAIRTNPKMKGVAEIVKEADVNNKNIVRVLENGEPVYVEVLNKDLLNMLEKVHTPEYGEITEAVKKLNNGIKQLITSKNPLFAITNTARDYQTYMVNSSEVNVLKRWGNVAKAISLISQDIAGKNMAGTELALYNAMGVNGSGIMAKSSHKTVENMTGRKAVISENTGAIEGYESVSKIKKGWTNFNNFLEIITGSTETTFRLAEFIGAINRGESVEEATLKSMEVTVDFSRGGDITKQGDAYVKYLNAGVQGLDNFFRNVGKNPARVLTRSLVHIAGPALLMAALNAGDDEYEMLDDRTKDNNFLIPLKLFGGAEGQYIKIPKAREYGMVAMLVERLVYESGFKNLGRSIIENISPPSAIGDNFITDLAKYKDDEAKDFAGRYIVPSALQELKKKDQYDNDTTVLNKWLGQITGLSPKKLDYYLDNYSGIIGDALMPLLMPSTYSNKDDVGKKAGAFLVNKFVADNTRSSSASSNYYDYIDDIEKTINKEQKDMTTEEKTANKTELKAFKSYINKKYGGDITDFNKMLKDNTLTSEEIKQIKKARNQAMKMANEEIKQYLSAKK